jgi:hypothetical protein
MNPLALAAVSSILAAPATVLVAQAAPPQPRRARFDRSSSPICTA